MNLWVVGKGAALPFLAHYLVPTPTLPWVPYLVALGIRIEPWVFVNALVVP